MKKEVSPRIQKAIDIYLDALNNGTLVKGSCSACAVGNLTAAAMGATLTRKFKIIFPDPIESLFGLLFEELPKPKRMVDIDSDKENNLWSTLFYTDQNGKQVLNHNPATCHCGMCENTPEEIAQFEEARLKAIEILSMTDFTMEELMRIEHVFETNTKISITEYLEHTAKEIRQDQINGLSAVVSLMLSFENESPERVHELFTEKANLIPVN